VEKEKKKGKKKDMGGGVCTGKRTERRGKTVGQGAHIATCHQAGKSWEKIRGKRKMGGRVREEIGNAENAEKRKKKSYPGSLQPLWRDSGRPEAGVSRAWKIKK